MITESGRWYIKGKYRFLVPTDRVFDSWSFPFVVNGTDVTVSKYVKAGKLGFRTGSLLWNDGVYYIISGSKKIRITGPDFFLMHGIDPQSARWVDDSELALHKTGEVY